MEARSSNISINIRTSLLSILTLILLILMLFFAGEMSLPPFGGPRWELLSSYWCAEKLARAWVGVRRTAVSQKALLLLYACFVQLLLYDYLVPYCLPCCI